MYPNQNVPIEGLNLDITQFNEIELLGRLAVSFDDCIWITAGIDSRRLDPQSRSFGIECWRAGLAICFAKMREVLERAAERGNASAAAKLHSDAARAPLDLRQQIVTAGPSPRQDLVAELALQSVDDAADEQRRLLAGEFGE